MDTSRIYKIGRKENFTKKEFSLLVDIEYHKDLVSLCIKQKRKSFSDWRKDLFCVLKISIMIGKYKCHLYYLRVRKTHLKS